MTATAHALVAGTIATQVAHPVLAPILALFSHYIMDAVPHWDFGTNWRSRSKFATGAIAIAETLFGITLTYFLFRGKADSLHLLTTVIASELPDWMEAPWYIFFAHSQKTKPSQKAGLLERITFRIYKMENTFHTKTDFPLGVFTQVAVVAFFFLLLS